MSKAPIDILMLRGIRSGRSGIYWLQVMAGAGLRRSESELYERAYGLAGELERTDEEIADTHVVDVLFFPLPKGWWFWFPCTYAAAFIWAAQRGQFTERVLAWGWSLTFFGVLALMVLLYKWVSEVRLKQEKLKARPLLENRRDELETDLLAIRDAIVAEQSKVMNPP